MASPLRQEKIVVAGAGAIGCFVGGHLCAAGRAVTFLARERIVSALTGEGLTLTDFEGSDVHIDPDALHLGSEAKLLADAELILVTVKSGATLEIAEAIRQHAAPGSIVVSLQNGVDNAAILERQLPGFKVVAGMVPFNVVSRGPGHFHRATGGQIIVGQNVAGLAEALSTPGLPVTSHADMRSVAWGKLLLNLNNALNALAGIPLREELADRRWRKILAASIEEALAALKAAGITPAKVGKVAASRLPFVLRLPNFLFERVAAAQIRIDPLARSSMWDDLEQRRTTEIEQLQGAVVALALSSGMTAKTNARVMELVRRAEANRAGSPRLAASDVGL